MQGSPRCGGIPKRHNHIPRGLLLLRNVSSEFTAIDLEAIGSCRGEAACHVHVRAILSKKGEHPVKGEIGGERV